MKPWHEYHSYYTDEQSRKCMAEFFKDAREELGYDKSLDEQGCKVIERTALLSAKRARYEDVFNLLSEYTEGIKRYEGELKW